MKAVFTILVVATLLCVVLSSEETDVLHCTGEKLSDGKFYFNTPYEVNKDIYDCETQWLIDEKVAGYSDDEGKMAFAFPIVNLTVSAAILQTCPENLIYVIMCPSATIHEKLQCSCASLPTMLPKVGFPNHSVYIWIGVSVLVVVIVIVMALIYQKKQGSGYVLCSQDSAENIV